MESNKHATPTFYEVVLKAKVAQLCESVGFHAITQDSSNVLIDIYRRTLHHLAKHCKDTANNNRRVDATIIDLVQAFDFVGIPIPELSEYIETTKLPFDYPINQDDLPSESTNKTQRNLPVDDLLEAEKNSHLEDQVDDGENKAMSESGLEDEEKPHVPLLRDTYEEIANNFTNITPVVADKKIRLGGRILLLANTKLKITTPILPEAIPSTSGIDSIKLAKKKKKNKGLEKNLDGDTLSEQSPIKSIKRTKGRKKNKLTREFILPEDDSDKEVSSEKVKIKIKEEKKQKSKDISKDKGRVKRPYNKKAKVAIKPLDPAIAEPPSFFPMEEDAQSVPLTIKSEKLTPSPKLTKESKTKRKKRDDVITGDDEVLDSSAKKGKGRKKLKTAITPLDPSIAEPPSFFPILETKLEDFGHIEPDKPPTPVPIARLPTPTVPTAKQSTSKSGKKKKKHNNNQFAIVTETVTDNDKEEKEWFCPACGSPDDGDWVQCDSCEDWYHLLCSGLKKAPEDEERWECVKCLNKIKIQAKKPQTPVIEAVKLKTPEPIIKTPTPTLTPQPQPQSLLLPALPPAPAPALVAATPVIVKVGTTDATVSQEDLCPECNLPDDGTMMIQCDDPFCAKWFHGKCVNLLDEPKEDESWFCKACVDKQQSAFKRRRKAK